MASQIGKQNWGSPGHMGQHFRNSLSRTVPRASVTKDSAAAATTDTSLTAWSLQKTFPGSPDGTRFSLDWIGEPISTRTFRRGTPRPHTLLPTTRRLILHATTPQEIHSQVSCWDCHNRNS